MSQHPPASIPQVFVLWHPKYREGERIARRILQWLRPAAGMGPEVFYRSLPDPNRKRLPPDLPDPTQKGARGQRSVSNLQIVVALIDEHMVSDWSWRHWLNELAPSTDERALMPVALDATAYNMPAKVREQNYLRPAGLPLAESKTLDDATFDVIVRSLLKQLTEAMCRLILPREGAVTKPSSTAPLPKVNVFLSHAKQDGTVPARKLRDYIYSQTQLTAFYDENDIAYGEVFGRVIDRALASNDTAAMIAVRSQKYASRPWCRRELSIFRRPREQKTGGAEQWRLYPSLIVEAMEGSQLSAGIAETGNSMLIRWGNNDAGLEELIVTTVIRDAMLASFHSALGASIPPSGKDQEDGPRIVINWLPDPASLLAIPAVRSGEKRQVLYPGRGLSGIELDILGEFFPKLTFVSFEDALLGSAGEVLL